MIARMAAIEPMMAGVSAPKNVAHASCTASDTPPTHTARHRFFIHALRSVSTRIMKGMRMNSGASCNTVNVDTSQSVCDEATPPGEISLQSVITGTPTAPNPVATVLPSRATRAENIGLKPRPISMAAGIATAVPNPAMPSRRPPKPHTIISTSTPRSSVNDENWLLITSMAFDSTSTL